MIGKNEVWKIHLTLNSVEYFRLIEESLLKPISITKSNTYVTHIHYKEMEN